MSENSISKLQRLQAERETCIKMAGNYQTSFQHSLLLFRRADKLQSQIESEVAQNALPIQSHNTADVP